MFRTFILGVGFRLAASLLLTVRRTTKLIEKVPFILAFKFRATTH
jgi:hypothetical protein